MRRAAAQVGWAGPWGIIIESGGTTGGGMCPSNGDEAAIQSFITEHTDDLVVALGGGPLPNCPGDLATCNTNLATCTNDLAVCQAEGFPATGQTTAYTADKNDGIGGAVAVPDDGTLQAGETLDYVDNGDGTVTDLNTGLMWEKKADNGGLHDRDNVYRWSGNGTQETIWDWVEDVNSEGGTGFAGYSDWRIPTKKELESIINAQVFSPAVSSAFNTGCVAACTPTTCSCTVSDFYWSSTTYAAFRRSPGSWASSAAA